MTSIVLTSGVFDLIHPGHIEHFNEAKLMAARTMATNTHTWINPPIEEVRLLILLNSDSSVSQLNRKFPPVFDQYERYAVLKSIGLVDDVILFDEPTPCTALMHVVRTIRAIDGFEGHASRTIFYTKGGDYADQTIPEHHICKEEEITLFFTKAKINSSSNIYSKIKEQLR